MRITLVVNGTMGDCNAYNLLAVALITKGYLVTLVVPISGLSPILDTIKDHPNFRLIVLPMDTNSLSFPPGSPNWQMPFRSVQIGIRGIGFIRGSINTILDAGLDRSSILVTNQATMWFYPEVLTDWAGKVVLYQSSHFRYDDLLGEGSFFPERKDGISVEDHNLKWNKFFNRLIRSIVALPRWLSRWKGKGWGTLDFYQRASDEGGFIYSLVPYLFGSLGYVRSLEEKSIYVVGPPNSAGDLPHGVEDFVQNAQLSSKKLIFIAMGSASTRPNMVKGVEEFAAKQDEYAFVISAPGIDEFRDTNIIVSQFIPYSHEIFERFHAIFSGGGTQTGYVLAGLGAPMGILAGQADQKRTVGFIVENGGGVAIDVEMYKTDPASAIIQVLEQIDARWDELKRDALDLKGKLTAYGDPAEQAVRAIEEIVSK